MRSLECRGDEWPFALVTGREHVAVSPLGRHRVGAPASASAEMMMRFMRLSPRSPPSGGGARGQREGAEGGPGGAMPPGSAHRPADLQLGFLSPGQGERWTEGPVRGWCRPTRSGGRMGSQGAWRVARKAPSPSRASPEPPLPHCMGARKSASCRPF